MWNRIVYMSSLNWLFLCIGMMKGDNIIEWNC